MRRAVVPCPQEVLEDQECRREVPVVRVCRREDQECRREDREHLECRPAHRLGVAVKNSRDCNNRCPALPVEQCLRAALGE